MNHSDWKENIGFPCLLIGVLTVLIGLIYVAISFFQHGSPAVFTLRTSLMVIIIGLVVAVFGWWLTQQGKEG